MTVNNRIKILRNNLKLSQPKFGEKIGVSRDVIANIELGRVEPKEMLLHHICSVFKVNPLWLIKGEGEIFIEIEDNIIEDLADIYELNQLETSLIKKFVSLNEADRKVILDFICSLNENEKGDN